jgi:hypothetical protein
MPIPSEEGADIVVNVNGKSDAKAEVAKRVNGVYLLWFCLASVAFSHLDRRLVAII